MYKNPVEPSDIMTETRNAIGSLAVHIVAAKCDLTTTPYAELVKELNHTIYDLEHAFDQLKWA